MPSGLVLAGRRLIRRARNHCRYVTTCSWVILSLFSSHTQHVPSVGTMLLVGLFSTSTSRLVFTSLGSCIFLLGDWCKDGLLAASRKGLNGPMHWESGGFIYLFILFCSGLENTKTFRKGGAAVNTRHTKHNPENMEKRFCLTISRHIVNLR